MLKLIMYTVILDECHELNLNTSHVKVNHGYPLFRESHIKHLNTSHVKVNPG